MQLHLNGKFEKLRRNSEVVRHNKIFLNHFRVDSTVLRVDDIYQREAQNRVVLQNLDWRLQRLEDLNINMFDMIQKMFYNQSFDKQDLPYIFHHRASWYDDDTYNREQQRRRRRRRSSLTGYELNYFQDKSLPKSTTTMSNQISMSSARSLIPDPLLLSKNSNQLQRRSTIHRLNSSTSNDSSITRIQSNEYTSITDGF